LNPLTENIRFGNVLGGHKQNLKSIKSKAACVSSVCPRNEYLTQPTRQNTAGKQTIEIEIH
jgi:hypothetical protein